MSECTVYSEGGDTTMDEQVQTGRGTNPLMIMGVIVVLLIVAGIFYFMQNTDEPADAITETQQPAEQSQPAQEDSTAAQNETMMADESTSSMVDDVLVVEMEAGGFYYEPNVIRARQGQTVRIVMTSVDMMHDLNIDALDVTIPVTQSGNTATVEFVADQPGEYEFYCSVGQHRAQGQVGTLIVE